MYSESDLQITLAGLQYLPVRINCGLSVKRSTELKDNEGQQRKKKTQFFTNNYKADNKQAEC